MLREWVRNMPLASLKAIVADRRARRSTVWRLAEAELSRRLTEKSFSVIADAL
jgi:hypothetical protein